MTAVSKTVSVFRRAISYQIEVPAWLVFSLVVPSILELQRHGLIVFVCSWILGSVLCVLGWVLVVNDIEFPFKDPRYERLLNCVVGLLVGSCGVYVLYAGFQYFVLHINKLG